MEDGRDSKSKIESPARASTHLPPDSGLSMLTIPTHKTPVGLQVPTCRNIDLFTPYRPEPDILHAQPHRPTCISSSKDANAKRIHDEPAT